MGYTVEFKNKIVQAIENGEDISSMLSDGKPVEKTIDDWYDKYQNNGLFTEDNNNDAIPSWSGYNYQGKSMLLLTLQMINKLLDTDDENFDEWAVELEKQQDFVFIKGGIVESLYQVKACLSKTTVARYEEALEKLLEDKESSNNKDAKCVLISAVNITNWDSTENNFKDEVELYKYRDEVVSLLNVIDHIKEELIKLLNKINVNTLEDHIYLILCDFIEIKIFQYHKNGRRSNYQILFSEIVKYIKESSIEQEEIDRLKFREEVYRCISKTIENYTNEACEECEDNDKCNFECGVLKNCELTKLVILEEYLKHIKPESDRGEVIENAIDKNIYIDNICEVYKVVSTNAINKENNVISFNYNKGNLKIIPTLLRINKECRISKTLYKINQNEAFKNIDKEFILTGDIKCRLLQTQADKFTNLDDVNSLIKDGKIIIERDESIKDILDNSYKKNKKIGFSQNITIINKNDLIEHLKRGQVDNE